MAQNSSAEGRSNGFGWLEASGLLHIFRTLRLAVHPAKLCFGLGGIVLTIVLGSVLDVVWKASSAGVEERAILRFIESRGSGQPFEEAKGDQGIFQVWGEHQRGCVLGLLSSSIPGASVAAGTPVGAYVESAKSAFRAQPLGNLAGMVYGVWWLLRYHPLYFVIFTLVTLLIWSFAGGAICRIAAVEFASDEKISVKQASRYAWEKLFDGFLLAPCIPLIFIAITVVLMVVGGMVLRLPVLGDLIGGIAFGLAILGGFVISILILGLLVGGSLLWPAVAVEGSDAFDSFSRSLSYPFTKPWKAIWYAVVATVFVAICWVFVNLFIFFMLTITRAVVSFGTSPFGWWSRGGEGETISKLELLWPLGGPNALYLSPEWGRLAWHEYFSAALIAVYVLLVVGVMWSFLASFYFSASTVVYYLLRRDVDATDLEDVYMQEDAQKETEAGRAAPPQEPLPSQAAPSDSAGNVSRPAEEEAPGAKSVSDDRTENESPKPTTTEGQASSKPKTPPSPTPKTTKRKS